MKATSIKLQNILGFEEKEITLGKITKISGRNGSGKTSIIRGILGAITKGTDATLVRNGADEGEIVMVLNDNTKITKLIPRDGSKSEAKVKFADHSKAGQAWINSMTNVISNNPIAFLTATGKEQVKIFLQAIEGKLNVSNEELARRAGEIAKDEFGKYVLPMVENPDDTSLERVPITNTAYGLDLVNALFKYYYDQRTIANRAAKEKQDYVDETMKSMPPEVDAVDVQGLRDELQVKRDTLKDKQGAAELAISKKENELLAQTNDAVSKINSDLEIEINRLRVEAQKTIDNLNSNSKTALDNFTKATNDTLAADTATIQTEIETLVSKISEGEFQQAEHLRGKELRDTVARYEEQVSAKKRLSELYTKALKGIEGYKEKLLANLPIPNLVVTNGDLYYEGKIWKDVNTAKQIDVAVKIAELLAGELGIACIDNLESYDSNSFALFEERAMKSNLQWVVSEVTDEDLKIETLN